MMCVTPYGPASLLGKLVRPMRKRVRYLRKRIYPFSTHLCKPNASATESENIRDAANRSSRDTSAADHRR